MNGGTYGDILKHKGVARFDVRAGSADNGVAYVKSERAEDISLFAVGICKECDIRATVRIVLYGYYLCGDTVFVALEVDDSVLGSVAATDVSDGDSTEIVSATGLVDADEEALFRFGRGDFRIIGYTHVAACGRSRFIFDNCHFCILLYDKLSKNSIALLSAVRVT